MVKFDIEEIKEKMKTINPDVEILSTEYKSNSSDLIIKCKNCGFERVTSWANLRNTKVRKGCKKCKQRKTPIEKSLYNIRPDLIKYFKNEEDAKAVYPSSKKELDLKCPDCGSIKKMSTNQLSNSGFACRFCSDGISIPNKFLRNILKQSLEDFEVEKSVLGNKYRYDGYFKLKNIEYFCEAHGDIHYNKTFETVGGDTLERIQENDFNKRTYVESIGAVYVEIDCRESNFEFLKNSFEKSFVGILDLSNINWNEIYKICTSSLVIEIANYYNNTHATPKEIARYYRIDRSTAREYLKRASKLNLCDYKPIKAQEDCRAVCQLTLNGEYIQTFRSVRNASISLGLNESTVRRVANKNRKAKTGFLWVYEDEYIVEDYKKE